MTAPDSPEHPTAETPTTAEELEHLRSLLNAATVRLLGDTIEVSDDDWRAPSRLPGWSRGHVASHLARQADALTRLAEWARTGVRQEMYASAEQRDAEIEAGAGRSGLDLQIDLDTSAGRLGAAFEALDTADGWDRPVELRGGLQAPARSLPLARLMEVVLHHVDLGLGFGLEDVDPTTAEWVLEWSAFRLRARPDYPSLLLVADSGFRLRLGSAGEPREISGSSPRLLGWLTRRSGAESVTGADGIDLPAF